MGFNEVEIESICIRQVSGIVHSVDDDILSTTYNYARSVDYPYLHGVDSTFIFVSTNNAQLYNNI